jgi:hypothetical protein
MLSKGTPVTHAFTRVATTLTYVGMTDRTTDLGFLACTPQCGEWIWFLAPLRPLPPDGEEGGR